MNFRDFLLTTTNVDFLTHRDEATYPSLVNSGLEVDLLIILLNTCNHLNNTGSIKVFKCCIIQIVSSLRIYIMLFDF